ncbi:MAG: BLUF domain-containing protein [Phycisphaerales bacterium]|nr:BLUF domain-containing protein [Phycisphaerales bacterium]
MELIRLSYRSVRKPTTSDDIVINGIVMPSIRRNAREDVTGCLWCGPTRFFQTLEGPREGVERIYADIERDPRHTDVELLELRPIDIRSFERFSMKLIRARESDEIGRLVDATRPPGAADAAPEPRRRTAMQAIIDILIGAPAERMP